MWATQAPRRSPPPWAEASCRGSSTSPLINAAIGDAGLVARAGPAAGPALEEVYLEGNRLDDEGLAAPVAPPPPPPAGGQVRRRRRLEC